MRSTCFRTKKSLALRTRPNSCLRRRARSVLCGALSSLRKRSATDHRPAHPILPARFGSGKRAIKNRGSRTRDDPVRQTERAFEAGESVQRLDGRSCRTSPQGPEGDGAEPSVSVLPDQTPRWLSLASLRTAGAAEERNEIDSAVVLVSVRVEARCYAVSGISSWIRPSSGKSM